MASALEKKFYALGFSSHSLYPFSAEGNLAPRDFKTYAATVRKIANEYEGRLKIFLGFEVDYLSPISNPRMDAYEKFAPDYLIGSVHFVGNEKGAFAVDDTIEKVAEGLKNCFAGNVRKMVGTYFACEREMLRRGNFAILGHADLVRKANSVLHFFDESETWYRAELKTLADEVARSNVVAEINTGAIARASMDALYPSDELLSLFFERGVPIMINSDAHRANDLDCAFPRAFECAKKIGYREVFYFDDGGMQAEKLEG